MLSELHDPHGRTQGLPPSHTDAESRCLRFVDRFGDALFNQRQVPVLITELRRQLERIQHSAVRQHGEAVLRLVESAEGKTHTYVRFIGD